MPKFKVKFHIESTFKLEMDPEIVISADNEEEAYEFADEVLAADLPAVFGASERFYTEIADEIKSQTGSDVYNPEHYDLRSVTPMEAEVNVQSVQEEC